MRKLISFIIIALLLCIFTPGIINANEEPEPQCTMKLINSADKTYVFWVKQIDHPWLWQTQGKPWIKIMAEIDPGESFFPENKQAPGLYTVICQERWIYNAIEMVKNFTIKAKTRTTVIIVTGKPTTLIIFNFDT